MGGKCIFDELFNFRVAFAVHIVKQLTVGVINLVDHERLLGTFQNNMASGVLGKLQLVCPTAITASAQSRCVKSQRMNKIIL